MKKKKICVNNGVDHPVLLWGKNMFFSHSTKINTIMFA